MDQRPVKQDQELTPINEAVIVELITNAEAFTQEVKERSGIIIPDKKLLQGQPNFGRVYAISEDLKKDELEFEIGDVIIFKDQQMFMGFRFNGKNLANIPVENIVGKVVK